MFTSFQARSTSSSVHSYNVSRSHSDVHHSLERIPQGKLLSKEALAEASMAECSHEEGANETQSAQTLECPVCMVDKSRDCFREISTCHHRCCSECLKEYFKIEIMESRLAIACPECSELFHPNDIRAIVQDSVLIEKYEDFMVRRVLAMDSDTRWCPAPDCGYAVIASGCAGCPKLKCEREGCNTYFCYHCKQYWHPNQTCDAARAERSPHMRSASISYSQESNTHNEIKSCPRCGAYIVKMDDGSCNHMTCAVCGAGFCWLCMKEISDLHYLSPSGCTFWGRKPWSRKKKILWQLGTLVGAPVGITLVAGIAVPAMIIGIPVWVGRKIHYRYDGASKHKRNLAITGGVAASIIAAPIIAGLAVGIGVPILLAYVYGVVPFSLCRSGGCGVTTTNTGGVRFEFDEHDDSNTQGPYAGDNHSMETAPNVANPSIAPSIGDASLGMTNSLSASGSHMDRAGILRDDSDRDSSSHRALAGSSINGSLCSATYSAQHHKLEVHADISESVHCERSSVGGESYNLSLTDDASTKALAGSIISHRDKDGISLCSRRFDTNAGHLAYPEETSEIEDEPGAGQQATGSSSCPTSPHTRKASPAPSEDARSARGKKCTRFMDQVSEIESKIDSVSIGSIFSNDSMSPVGDAVTTTAAASSTMSLTTSTVATAKTTLASCESLISEGKSESIGHAGKIFSFGNGGRVKAESTSVLMECAESRRSEMGRPWRKSGSASRDDLIPAESSILSRRKGSGTGNREHQSQPGNLSDISDMKGMPNLHAAGCSDLLAVIDASCENVFLNRAGQTKLRLMSNSSCSSSSGDPIEAAATESFVVANRAILEPCAAADDDYIDDRDILKGAATSFSNAGRKKQVGAEDLQSSKFCFENKQKNTCRLVDGWSVGQRGGAGSKYNIHEEIIADGDVETQHSPVSLYRWGLHASSSSASCDSPVTVSPLPDVELPVIPVEVEAVVSLKQGERKTSPDPSAVSWRHGSASNPSISGSSPALSAKWTKTGEGHRTDFNAQAAEKLTSVPTFPTPVPSSTLLSADEDENEHASVSKYQKSLPGLPAQTGQS